MHWFWRAVIAVEVVGVGSALGTGWVLLSMPLAIEISRTFASEFAGIYLVCMVPFVAVSLLPFSALNRWFYAVPGDYETVCRKCQYILRGLTEPRCPECGERI